MIPSPISTVLSQLKNWLNSPAPPFRMWRVEDVTNPNDTSQVNTGMGFGGKYAWTEISLWVKHTCACGEGSEVSKMIQLLCLCKYGGEMERGVNVSAKAHITCHEVQVGIWMVGCCRSYTSSDGSATYGKAHSMSQIYELKLMSCLQGVSIVGCKNFDFNSSRCKLNLEFFFKTSRQISKKNNNWKACQETVI